MQRHIRYLIGTSALAIPVLILFTNMSSISKEDLNCQLVGQEVPEGQSIIVYQSPIVPVGEQCVSETRKCEKGVLSGSYVHPICHMDSPEQEAKKKFNTGKTL